MRGYDPADSPGSAGFPVILFVVCAMVGVRSMLVPFIIGGALMFAVHYLRSRFPPRTTAFRLTPTGIEIGPVGQTSLAEVWNPSLVVATVSSMNTSGLNVSRRTLWQGDDALSQTLFLSLPPASITTIADQCNTWIASAGYQPTLRELIRICPQCRHEIDDIAARHCSKCGADASHAPARIPLYSPPPLTGFHRLLGKRVDVTIVLTVAVLFLLRATSANMAIAVSMLLALVVVMLTRRPRKPGPGREWRVAPAGQQMAWPTDPVKLKPWLDAETFHFRSQSLGVQQLRRTMIVKFFVFQTKPLRLSSTAARALAKAGERWFKQK